MNRRRSRRQKKLSERQERSAAQDIGGRVQAGSGNARLGGGGDVRKMYEHRVECKYTDNPTYIVKLKELEKVQMQAIQGGAEQPVLQFAFRIPYTERFEHYAVIPVPPIPDDVNVTEAKQVSLNRDRLRQSFSSHDEMTFTFRNKATGACKTYAVMPWQRFLDHHLELPDA